MALIINMKKTGENIRKLRKEIGLSTKDLSAIFGFTTPQSINKWERGDGLPTVDHLVILADTLNVSIDNLLITEKVEY